MRKKTIVPGFKTEAEEAEWWYTNRAELDKDFLKAAKEGKLKRLDQPALKARLAGFEIACCFHPVAGRRY